MTYAVRVTDDYVGLMGRYVAEGQSIVPGAPLVDIMTPEGIVETIKSEGWGIVAHIEGGRIFAKVINVDEDDDTHDDEDDSDDGEGGQGRSSSGGMGAVFHKNDVICHIVGSPNHGGRGAGLHPRHSQSLNNRRLMGISR